MTQQELDRAVADATGEDLREVIRRGFSIARRDDEDFDPEPDDRLPQVVDWDELDAERNVAIYPQTSPRRCVA